MSNVYKLMIDLGFWDISRYLMVGANDLQDFVIKSLVSWVVVLTSSFAVWLSGMYKWIVRLRLWLSIYFLLTGLLNLNRFFNDYLEGLLAKNKGC